MEMHAGHRPALYEETLRALRLRPGMTVCDGTLGGGGHAEGILKAISPGGTLIGVDRDPDAVARVTDRLSGDRVFIVRANFFDIGAVLSSLCVQTLDGALLDLGVSSYQLEDADRGFSYMQDAPLDMRMDKDAGVSARDLVNTASKPELARIIREYGEERWADRVADYIATEREKEPIETTSRLVSVIRAAIPKGARKEGPHPAKRTFQALRIAVNGELEGLEHALEEFAGCLAPGGRLAVITFHSLEDRIVKKTFRRLSDPCECPKDLPCVCGKKPTVRIIGRRPVVPSETELENNPRARSAKLRVIEKI